MVRLKQKFFERRNDDGLAGKDELRDGLHRSASGVNGSLRPGMNRRKVRNSKCIMARRRIKTPSVKFGYR